MILGRKKQLETPDNRLETPDNPRPGEHQETDPLLDAFLARAGGDPLAVSVFGGTPYYDIAKARETRRVSGLALIFFMGLGDYLMATPVLEALHLAHPDLPMWGYVSTTEDAVNSPLVETMLRLNPNFDKVFTYRGQAGYSWRFYDFRDALKDIPADFLVLPVIWGTSDQIWHRVTALSETFGLPVEMPVSLPIVPDVPLTGPAQAILADIRRLLDDPRRTWKGLTICHFDGRSTGYIYPFQEKLIRGLLSEDFAVATLTSTHLRAEGLIGIDVSTITPIDTVQLLRTLREEGRPIGCISVSSVMWYIAAAAGVKTLGIHPYWDGNVHHIIYPNTFVLTHHAYHRIPPWLICLVRSAQYFEERASRKAGVTFADYYPEVVLNFYRRILAFPC